jgi:hypothetical protein
MKEKFLNFSATASLVLVLTMLHSVIFEKKFFELPIFRTIWEIGMVYLIVLFSIKKKYSKFRLLLSYVFLCFVLYIGNKFTGITIEVNTPMNWIFIIILVSILIYWFIVRHNDE